MPIVCTFFLIYFGIYFTIYLALEPPISIWEEGIVDDHGAVRLEIQRVEFGIAGITMYLMVVIFRYLVVDYRICNFHRVFIRFSSILNGSCSYFRVSEVDKP